MPNPNFKPLWLPVHLYERMARIRRRLIQAQVQSDKEPTVAMHSVVRIALNKSKIEEILEMRSPPRSPTSGCCFV